MSLSKDIEVYLRAIDLLAKSEVPSWMNWVEKKAYALGIIKDSDFVTCDVCGGTTWLCHSNPNWEISCWCVGAKGKMISLDAKRLINELYPEYSYDPPCYLLPRSEDTPEEAALRARVREQVIDARRRGLYELAEHLTSEVLG